MTVLSVVLPGHLFNEVAHAPARLGPWHILSIRTHSGKGGVGWALLAPKVNCKGTRLFAQMHADLLLCLPKTEVKQGTSSRVVGAIHEVTVAPGLQG